MSSLSFDSAFVSFTCSAIVGISSATALTVYSGKLTGQFADDVREGTFPVEEGVIFKGVINDTIWMAKIKTYTYRQSLKQAFANGWKSHWE